MYRMLFSSSAFTLIVILFVSIYFYVKYLYSYWQRRGVPYLKPSFPFGNFGKNFRQKITLGLQLDEFYRATTEPFVGVYGLFRPTLIVRDTNLIRQILIKDFPYFVNRGVYVDEENDPLSAHLFSLEGDKWKSLRQTLTPTFTSGKMKAIFSTLLECKNPLLSHLTKVTASNETIDACELMSCYLTNVIASVAFGIEIDSFSDPNEPFRKYGRQFFALNLKNSLRQLLFQISPTLMKWSRIRFMDREVEEFITMIVKQTLDLREKNKIVRKDFFQLLVQLRNSGQVQLDDDWQTVISHDNNKTLSIEQITAQSFLFFLAGFETSATTMTFCLYELARNIDIQRKVQMEIDQILAANGGQFTYESINELKFLECCINETLRKYPVLPALTRECANDYKIPGTQVTLEKGTSVVIPIYSLQHDEKYYANPEKFDPSRFSSGNKNGKTINEMPFLPFGDGPRNCIGLRMGKTSTKVGIATVLHRYNVLLGDQHLNDELQFSPAAFILTPTIGIQLKFIPRNGNK